MDDETDTVVCWILEEREKSFKLRDDNDFEREAFFPKSQINFDRRNVKTGRAVAQIPVWLLKEKGWD